MAVNAAEGLMRIAKVVRWLGYLSVFVIVLAGGAGGTFKTSNWWTPLVLAAIFYAAAFALAWVIEGFAKPKA